MHMALSVFGPKFSRAVPRKQTPSSNKKNKKPKKKHTPKPRVDILDA